MQLELILVNPESAMCDEWRSAFAGFDSVSIVEGKYEDLAPHDCFVTAANSFGLMTAGIDAAVVQFHGQGLMDRLQLRIQAEFLGEQPVGTAFLNRQARQVFRSSFTLRRCECQRRSMEPMPSTSLRGRLSSRSTDTTIRATRRSGQLRCQQWALASAMSRSVRLLDRWRSHTTTSCTRQPGSIGTR